MYIIDVWNSYGLTHNEGLVQHYGNPRGPFY